jgi:hypothetical protein
VFLMLLVFSFASLTVRAVVFSMRGVKLLITEYKIYMSVFYNNCIHAKVLISQLFLTY